MEDYLIAVFQRPGDAAIAQRALLEQKLRVAMMPSPRGVSVSCGLSLRFAPEDLETVRRILRELFPEQERVCYYRAVKEAGQRRFYPVECSE